MKWLLVPNYTRSKTAEAVQRTLAWAKNQGIAIVMERLGRVEGALHPEEQVIWCKNISDEVMAGCDEILTIGGDGTMVRTATHSAQSGVPLVGVNTGRLGFLTQIELPELEDRLERLSKRQYQVEQRSALAAGWPGGYAKFAMNDIVLQKIKQGGLACIEAYRGQELIGRYRADGLILSTATGSTAYACAAGGPIVDGTLNVTVLIPICPQNRMNVPLICKMDTEIFVTIYGCNMRILVDGEEQGRLEDGECITIYRSPQYVPLIKFDKKWNIIDWQKKVYAL